LRGREGFEVVFVELKRLLSIAPGARTGGEVTRVFLAEKYSSDAGYGSFGR
jgi:hypothetical protein